MHTKPTVPGREIGMVAAPGAAGIAEPEDPLLVVHEGLCLGEIGGPCTGLDTQALAFADDPP